MKKIFLTPIIGLLLISTLLAQNWDKNGDNHSTGKLGLGTSTPSKDIHISRSNALAGIDVYNTDVTGRSTVLVGEGNGGRYIYMGYLNPNYSTTFGAFQPASGVLYTGAPNGMRLISSNYISLTAGGLQGAQERIRITSSGDIGFGTSSPNYKLDVYSSSNDEIAARIFNPEAGANASSGFRVNSQGNNVRLISFADSHSTNAHENWLVSQAGGSSLVFGTQDVERMRILANGNVGIGTDSPDSRLTVAGKIHSQEVKVSIDAGADFVFNSTYQLRTLEETEEFISKNSHLPEIASEKEMLENGIEVGEMNIKLLQKVEELTLYLIEQNKEITEMKKEISALKNK